jgi:hypothetical protein
MKRRRSLVTLAKMASAIGAGQFLGSHVHAASDQPMAPGSGRFYIESDLTGLKK